MAKILLVEDDIELSDAVKDYLTGERHVVDQSFTGKEGMDRLGFYKYELVILDWNLPEMTGLEICQHYRRAGGRSPILFLTGRREVDDRTSGLDSGADDYLTKPFAVKELGARVRALLRRPAAVTTPVFTWAHVELDPSSSTVTSQGRPVKLVPSEFALLEFLMRHPGAVFSADALLDRVWKSASDATFEAVTTCVKRLRKKLDVEGQASIIATVHGRGYRLGDPK